MSRGVTIRVSALNLVIMNPESHTPAAYRSLVELLASQRRAIQVRGEQYLELDSQISVSDDGKRLSGLLHRFTSIEAFNWFNTQAHRLASPEERRNIRVPPNMSANYREIPFSFDLKSHTLVFLTKGVRKVTAPAQVLRYFEKACDGPAIRGKWGEIVVTLEQDEQHLGVILESPGIRMLRITINRPNESQRKYEDIVFERMRARSTRREVFEFQADEAGGLKPDNGVRENAYVAISNGHVDARIKVGNAVEEFSTLDKPLTEQGVYRKDEETLLQAFVRVCNGVITRLAARREN